MKSYNYYTRIPELISLEAKIEFLEELPFSNKEYYKSDILKLALEIIKELRK